MVYLFILNTLYSHYLLMTTRPQSNSFQVVAQNSLTTHKLDLFKAKINQLKPPNNTYDPRSQQSYLKNKKITTIPNSQLQHLFIQAQWKRSQEKKKYQGMYQLQKSIPKMTKKYNAQNASYSLRLRQQQLLAKIFQPVSTNSQRRIRKHLPYKPINGFKQKRKQKVKQFFKINPQEVDSQRIGTEVFWNDLQQKFKSIQTEMNFEDKVYLNSKQKNLDSLFKQIKKYQETKTLNTKTPQKIQYYDIDLLSPTTVSKAKQQTQSIFKQGKHYLRKSILKRGSLIQQQVQERVQQNEQEGNQF